MRRQRPDLLFIHTCDSPEFSFCVGLFDMGFGKELLLLGKFISEFTMCVCVFVYVMK